MDKRTAMRIACGRAAGEIQSDIDGGGIYSDPAVESEEDGKKVKEAMEKLRDELNRRAGDQGQQPL